MKVRRMVFNIGQMMTMASLFVFFVSAANGQISLLQISDKIDLSSDNLGFKSLIDYGSDDTGLGSAFINQYLPDPPEDGAIKGTITDIETEEPIQDAEVTLVDKVTYTDNSGFYHFSSVTPGDYYITVFAENYYINSTSVSIQSEEITTQNIELQKKPPENIIVLVHGWQPSGTVKGLDEIENALNQKLEELELFDKTKIINYTWEDAATLPTPSGYYVARTVTRNEGEKLAKEVFEFIYEVKQNFDEYYKPTIHFIGHSLGTMVSTEAVSYLYHEENISVDQLTLLDTPLNPSNPFVNVCENNFFDHSGYFYDLLPKGSVLYIDNFYIGEFFTFSDGFNLKFGQNIRGTHNTKISENGIDHVTISSVKYPEIIKSNNWNSLVLPDFIPQMEWVSGVSIPEICPIEYRLLSLATANFHIIFNNVTNQVADYFFKTQSPAQIIVEDFTIDERTVFLEFDYEFDSPVPGELSVYLNDSVIWSESNEADLDGLKSDHVQIPIGIFAGMTSPLIFELLPITDEQATCVVSNIEIVTVAPNQDIPTNTPTIIQPTPTQIHPTFPTTGDLNKNGIRDAGDINLLVDLIFDQLFGREISIDDLQTADVYPEQPDGILDARDYTALIDLVFDDLLSPPQQPTPTMLPVMPTTVPTATPTQTPRPTATPTPITMALEETITVPLDELPSNALPLQMNLIPAGTFVMGSPSSEDERQADESPQHEVTISNPFYMSAYPITQEQWATIVSNNPSAFTGSSNLPVDSILWVETLDFIQGLNELNIGKFRLPTEAEWEYACRAGTRTRYYWGDDTNNSEFSQYAWNFFNTNGRSQPVAQKQPNGFGLFDMSGNMQEWCSDWYGSYSSESQVDPIGPISGDERVIRGGFWGGSHGGIRSAARGHLSPSFRSNTVSFRVVMEVPNSSTPNENTGELQTVSSTQFGANIQSFASNSIDTEIVDIMSSDNLKVIRYFAQESVADNINMMQQALNNGMQVIMTFGTSTSEFGIDCNIGPCTSTNPTDCCNTCWWNLDLQSFDNQSGQFDRRYTCTPKGYAEWIAYRISHIEQAIPGVIGNVLIGVQIGNEEEEKWGFSFNEGYSAGRAYADYYLAAEETLTMRWSDLLIFGGSIESHRSLDFSLGGESSRFLGDNGRGGRGFLNGFVQEVMEQNNFETDRLPGVIAINGYPGEAPPEYLNQGEGTKEWIQRLNTLDSIFQFYGYSPRYANMEYGFSPRESSVYGTTGADGQTQAVYYLRYNLMNATTQSTQGSIWDYVLYWVHPFNGETIFDTGWFGDPNKTNSSSRPIRRIGQVMHSEPMHDDILGINGDYEIWIPANSERGEGTTLQDNNKMYCGWINAAGQKWGAVWRYKNNVESYYETQPQPEEFTVEGDFPGLVHLYKFVFDEPYSYSNTHFVKISDTPIEGNYIPSQNKTVYDLPTYLQSGSQVYPVVNENPVFLKFE